MKLVYDVIEDAYDDTTQIRTMTEQARLPSGDWLIRTTIYTPHHIGMDVTRIRGEKRNPCLRRCNRDIFWVTGPARLARSAFIHVHGCPVLAEAV
jgi:hypothetical protein